MSYFSLHHHPQVTHTGYENKGNNCQVEEALNILIVSTLGNV